MAAVPVQEYEFVPLKKKCCAKSYTASMPLFYGFFLQEHVFNEIVFFYSSDNDELSYFISLLVVINQLSNSSTYHNFYSRSRCQTKTSQLPTETFMVFVLYSFNLFYLFGMEQLWGTFGGWFCVEGRL